MTIEEILQMSVSELEAMSDAQLTEYFKPFFAVTKPEMAKNNKPITTARSAKVALAEQARAMAKKYGIAFPE